MGIGFRKSMKIAGMRVNFSKSGIGVSTGMKGLRVGVNSKGKSYISAGTHGIYYRKTFSSSAETRNAYSYSSYESSTSNRGCLLWGIGFFCSVIGIVYPILFAVPGIMLIFYLLDKVKLSVMKKRILEFTNKINTSIDKNNFELLEKIIDDMQQKITKPVYILPIYENTYRHLLKKALEDNVISDAEKKVIELYKAKISSSKFDVINSSIIDEIVAEIIKDGEVTDQENEYLNKVITVLQVNNIKQQEINSIILETKKIDALRKNGLKVIELHNEIIKGKECYYTGKIEMLKIRQSKGEQYYESDSTADIYISQDLIDIVGDGHKKIKTKDIINIELKDNIIEIIVLNRQKAICLKSSEPSLIIAIIGEIKKNS